MDDDTPMEYAGDASGQLHPALDQLNQATGGLTKEASDKIQDFVTGRAIADQAHAEGQHAIVALDQTKQNLLGMVQRDPRATDLAMELVGDTIGKAGEAHGVDVSGIEAHTRSEIAHAAVQSWAAVNPAAAREALDRYSDHFDDDTRGALDSYIGHMDLMRRADNAGSLLQRQQQQELTSARNSMNYLGALTDKDTGALSFPEGWGTKAMQDMSLSPQAKAGLFNAYKNLQLGGDPVYSNPNLLTDLIGRAALPHNDPDHPHTNEVIGHAGGGLTLEDAGFVGSLLGPQKPEQRAVTAQLSDAMADARDQIGNTAAYGRFVNWFLPAVRQLGGAGLDPNSKDYLLAPERMARFQPTGDDVIERAVRKDIARPPLRDFFGGYAMRPSRDDYMDTAHDKYNKDRGVPGRQEQKYWNAYGRGLNQQVKRGTMTKDQAVEDMHRVGGAVTRDKMDQTVKGIYSTPVDEDDGRIE